MQVKGSHSFKVSKQQLWDYLMDKDVLEKITPGVSKLEPIDNDAFKTISDIKIGPVKGSFKGKLKVVDKNEPNSFALEMEQLSKIGNAHARIEMNLADAESNDATLSFDGKAKLSGVIARTGQRVLSGVANAITKEVFASLEKHIEEDASAESHQAPQKETTEAIAEKETPIATIENKTTEAIVETEAKIETQNPVVQKIPEPTTGPPNNPPPSGGFLQSIINFFKNLFN